MFYDEGDYLQAVIDLPKHLERYPKSSLNAQARWFIAWSYVQLKDDEKATQALGNFVGTSFKRSLKLQQHTFGWENSLKREEKSKYSRIILIVSSKNIQIQMQAWYVSLYQEISFPSSETISLDSFATIPVKLDIAVVHQSQKLASAGFEVQARAQLQNLSPQ